MSLPFLFLKLLESEVGVLEPLAGSKGTWLLLFQDLKHLAHGCSIDLPRICVLDQLS